MVKLLASFLRQRRHFKKQQRHLQILATEHLLVTAPYWLPLPHLRQFPLAAEVADASTPLTSLLRSPILSFLLLPEHSGRLLPVQPGTSQLQSSSTPPSRRRQHLLLSIAQARYQPTQVIGLAF